MIMLIIITCTLAFTSLGRVLLGRWYNHLTIYAGIWGMMLALFELKFIHYYDLNVETWIVIIDGFLAFLFGVVTIVFARLAIGPKHIDRNRIVPARDPGDGIAFLRAALWILNVVSFLAVLQHWYILLQTFGSAKNVILMGNLVRSFRASGQLTGELPYFDALALAGTFFAGLYTSKVKKLSFIATAPILIVVFEAISGMGRATLLIAIILFLSGYFLSSSRSRREAKSSFGKKLRISLVLAFGLAILLGSAELIRSSRGVIEHINGASTALERLSNNSFITPSIYLYLSGQPGVLNQYLKVGEEKGPWGGNTFAPIYRIIAKFGFDTYVKEYQLNYFTPVRINTGTYLREIHADFGIPGILIVPYLMGFLTTYVWYRAEDRNSYLARAILAHLMVIVVMSFFIQATRLGYWLVSFVGAACTGWILDRMRPGFRFVENRVH
jgi:oligosaccharide repeat unit polymerase